MQHEELEKLAAEAYRHGYPRVYAIEEQIKHAGGGHPSTGPARPVNAMGYSDILLGPETKFVSPNNDTFYMSLDADVAQEPLVLHVPDTNDRYYVLQFVDAWTNNFASVGRRATGTKEGFFLLAGPDWQGEVPDGVSLVRAPTNIFHWPWNWASGPKPPRQGRRQPQHQSEIVLMCRNDKELSHERERATDTEPAAHGRRSW